MHLSEPSCHLVSLLEKDKENKHACKWRYISIILLIVITIFMSQLLFIFTYRTIIVTGLDVAQIFV